MSDINNQGFELDWDSEIEKDGQEYITLPEGVYPFTVMNFERARYNPSAKAKLPPCNMAVMSLQFKGAEGVATSCICTAVWNGVCAPSLPASGSASMENGFP